MRCHGQCCILHSGFMFLWSAAGAGVGFFSPLGICGQVLATYEKYRPIYGHTFVTLVGLEGVLRDMTSRNRLWHMSCGLWGSG